MKKINLFVYLIIIISPFIFSNCKKNEPVKNWICYYGKKIPPAVLSQYELVILDPDNFGDVAGLSNKYKIAYISIGEAENYRWYWDNIKGAAWLGKENPNWPGSIKTDIRSEEWQYLILNRIIPKILSKGYNGIFLDTVNEAVHDELNKVENSSGKTSSFIDFLKKIKMNYPDIFIFQNSGLDILDKTEPYIDGILVESLTATYDFNNKKYINQDKLVTKKIVSQLVNFKKETGKQILIIDYVDGKNQDIINRAIKICRRYKFSFYLAEIELNKIYRF